MRQRPLHFAAKPLCMLLILSFILLDLSSHPVQAGLIGTESIIRTQANEAARDRVFDFLAREEVQQAMAAQGVPTDEIAMRVAYLTDKEIERIAQDIDQLPAGADAGGIVGAVVFVFVLLLVTDILGLTKVFPFTRSIR